MTYNYITQRWEPDKNLTTNLISPAQSQGNSNFNWQQPQSSFNMFQQTADGLLRTVSTKMMQTSVKPGPKVETPNLGPMQQSNPSGQIAPTKIKPIGDALKQNSATASGFGKGIGTKAGTSGDISKPDISGIVSSISSLVPKYDNQSELTSGINTGYDTTADLLMLAPTPELKAAGAIMKGMGAAKDGLDNITGGATAIDNPTNAVDSILTSKAGFLYTRGLSILNSVTAKKVAGSSKELANQATSASYGKTDELAKTEIGGLTNAGSVAIGTIGGLFKGKSLKDSYNNAKGDSLVNRRKNAVNEINTVNYAKSNVIKDQNQMLSAINPENNARNNQMQTSGEFNKQILLSKQGSKLEKLKEFAKNKKVKGIPPIKGKADLNDPQGSLTANNARDFDSGGFKVNLKTDEVKLAQHGSVVDGTETIGKDGMEITKKNVIPSGALHAHKHNLLDEGREMTKKGIPVITVANEGDIIDEETEEKAKGGEIIQHAEIEKEEIILTLTLTQKIEEFRKDGSKEAMIKAGELLAKEIMENTEDNTGLIEKLTDNEN